MQIIEKYFPALSPVQKEQMGKLKTLYAFWNSQINVISRRDIEHLYLHHILHSLAIARIITFNAKTIILDIGTGGGFPGIPLAVMFPDAEFILVDSIAKKIKVVDAVIRELQLNNCRAISERAERLTIRADFVTARAVTEINTLYAWTRKIVVPGGTNTLKNGLLAIKGGELDTELKSVHAAFRIFNLNVYFDEPFFETKKLVYVER